MRQPDAKTLQLREVMLLYCVIVPARALSNGGILTGNKLMLRIYGWCALLYAATLKKKKKAIYLLCLLLNVSEILATTHNTYTHTLVRWGYSNTRLALYSLCDLAYWTMDFQVLTLRRAMTYSALTYQHH